MEVSDDESSETIVKRRKAVENRFSEEEQSRVRGNRIVDLNWLAKMLEAGCEFCGKTPLLLSKIKAEYRKGFVSIFKVTCDRCNKLNAIRTQKPNAYRNPEDLNSMAVLGTLHNGIGVSHLQSIMAAVEVPSLSVNGYKNVENYVGKVMEMEAEHSCMQAGIEEKILSELKGQSGESVSIDEGWQKKGAAMNSMSGHSPMIGELSKKVISCGVRIKGGCRTCLYSNKNKQTPKDHDCRVNHDGSSKSMESASAVSMLEKAIDKGLNIIGLTTDEDSSTHAKCATEIPSNTRRRKTDVNHCKKSITKRLYILKKERCFLELNPKSISYFGRCFAYSIRQNKGNESKIRKAIEAIVPHAYGDHNKCNSDWCRYLRNPETFIYRRLPAGKPLRNPSLKIELEKILGSFLSNEMIEKLVPCTSTQANESFNSMVSYKCPKARHYSGSKSISYRVAATVCQKNEGYTYLGNIASRLGIASRGVLKKYVKFRNRKAQQEKVRKSLRAVKLSRLTKRISSLMHEDRKLSKEGKDL